MTGPRPEVWGGVECTVNRVGDRYFDQVRRAGHHTRADDLDRFAALGVQALRYPIVWERTAPDGVGDADWRWADERLARLRQLGLRPIVGLIHHGSGPRYAPLPTEAFAEGAAAFAAAVAARYPWLEDFTPVNEPLTTARFAGLYGVWYPHGRDPHTFVRTLLVQMRALSCSACAPSAASFPARASCRRRMPDGRSARHDSLPRPRTTTHAAG
jgi:dTDP-4-dehydrorhamnose reductase